MVMNLRMDGYLQGYGTDAWFAPGGLCFSSKATRKKYSHTLPNLATEKHGKTRKILFFRVFRVFPWLDPYAVKIQADHWRIFIASCLSITEVAGLRRSVEAQIHDPVKSHIAAHSMQFRPLVLAAYNSMSKRLRSCWGDS